MLRSLAIATQFLTRLPVPARWDGDDALVRAAGAFPLVGAAIGALTALAGLAAQSLDLPAPLPAILALLVAYTLVGPLHWDGVADVADGLAAGPRALEAMADPALGSAGTCSLVLGLLTRAALLDAALALPPPTAAAIIVSAACVARWTPLLLPRLIGYAARPQAKHGGMSQRWFDDQRPLSQALALLTAAAVAIAALGPAGALALLAAALTTALLAARLWRSLGGATGDALGAAVELGDSAALLTLLVALPHLPPVVWPA